MVGVPVFLTVGTAEEARRALTGGADGVQGVEAGGHLAGTDPLSIALPRFVEVVDERVPIPRPVGSPTPPTYGGCSTRAPPRQSQAPGS